MSGAPPGFMGFALYTELRRARAKSKDGGTFRVHDALVDDERWALTHLVVGVGRRVHGRRVLVPAEAIDRYDPAEGELQLRLTRDEVEHEPIEDAHPPRSEERVLESFCFQLPIGPGVFHIPSIAGLPVEGDPHLWSARDLIGYGVRTGESTTGHVEDLAFDPEGGWAVRSIVVELGRARRVPIEPAAVERIHWLGATVHVRLTRGQLLAPPEWRLERFGALGAPG